jgi:Methyltransferase domain
MRWVSPIYWSPFLYRMVMRLLYGRAYQERYKAVARLIPDRAIVVELCCGCGYLYEKFLRQRQIDYLGIDLLPQMVGRLRRLGAKVWVGDVLTMDVPSGEVCVMLGSLYHFHPNEEQVLAIMARSDRAILLEPVRNLSAGGYPLVRLVGKYLSYIGETTSSYRLNSDQLNILLYSPQWRVLSDHLVLSGKYRLVEFTRA